MNGITQLLARSGLVLSLLFSPLFSGEAAEWTSSVKDHRSVLLRQGASGEPTTITLPSKAIEIIDVIEPKNLSGEPFILVRGASCEKCPDEPKVLFLQNAKSGSKLFTLVHPGKVFDPKKSMLLFEGRSFYGECVSSGKTSFVTFQREHIGKRKGYQKSTFIADLEADGTISERLIEGRRAPRIEFALKQVRSKQCTEIAGIRRDMMKKAFDYGPSRVGLAAEEDEEKQEEEIIKAKEPVVPEAAPEIPASKPESESSAQ